MVTFRSQGSLEVDTADVQNRAVNLVPLPGTIILETQPSGASVVIDGQTVGTTPLTLEEVPREKSVSSSPLSATLLWKTSSL